MRKFAAITVMIYGMFLLWSAFGLFFDSNHGGRLVESAYDQLTSGPDAIEESTAKGKNVWIEMLATQGRLGFDLLDKAILLQALSGLIITVLGMIFYPSKNWLAIHQHVKGPVDSIDPQSKL